MSAILNRYRLRDEAPPRRVSAEFAFGSPRILQPMSVFLHRPSIQSERDEALRHHAFPLRTTLSLANLHHCPYPSQQASTPPNLHLFRRDSFLFVGDFSRDPAHRLFRYLLGALGMEVSVESLSTWPPNFLSDDPNVRPLQITLLCDVQTRVVLGVHICARHAVCEWVLGTVDALANHPNGRPGQTRAGIKHYPRTGRISPPTNQLSGARPHGLKGPRSFIHNHGGTPHRPQRYF